jgi:N-acetylmuramoyl-L-alanine amidase
MRALAAALLLVTAGWACAEEAAVRRIEIGDHGAVVRIHLTAETPVHARALPAAAGAPERVFVDLEGARLTATTPRVVPGDGPILRVRTGQFTPTTARVVVDLVHAVPFRVEVGDRTVTVQLVPPAERVEAPVSTPPAPEPIPPPAEPPPAVPPRSDTAPPPDATPPPARHAARADPEPAATDRPTTEPTADPEPAATDHLAAEPPADPEPAATDRPATEPAARPEPAATDRPAAEPAARPAPRAERPEKTPKHAPPAVAEAPRPLVVIDPGHGGRDPGATGLWGVVEKDVVLSVAQLVAERLGTRLPVDVVLTRTDDSSLSIDARLLSAQHATLFVSLHANASSDARVSGIEVFYGGGGIKQAGGNGTSVGASRLGRSINEALRTRVVGVRGRARPGPFRVLEGNTAPSALIEIGYVTHYGDALRTQDGEHQSLLADALVDGIAAFLRATRSSL